MTEVQKLAKIMVLKDLYKEYELLAKYNGGIDYDRYCALEMAIKALEQEQKIKVLNRDEAIKKLGTVDIYQASAWITLLNDLGHLGLRICEVKE